MTRKIFVITGTRAEYGILKPVLYAIKNHPELNLQLLVTGMHLSHEFGYTANDIKGDGFTIDFLVDMLLSQDTPISMTKSLAIGILGIVDILSIAKPDIVLIAGDRNEAFAGAIAASYLSIPVVHLFGGDSAQGSNIDDCIRHSITRFAHIHLVMTGEHSERLNKMGEEPWRIFIVGSPAIDTILKITQHDTEIILKKYGIDSKKPFILLLQHPTTINQKFSEIDIDQSIEAAVELGLPTVIIYPNSDPGGRAMIKKINKYKKCPTVKILENLPYEDFLDILSTCAVLVGNSSSGIFEAPSFKTPVVNIGLRQAGRGHTNNIINVSQSKEEIQGAIKRALFDESFKEDLRNIISPYGDGHASEKIINVLMNININQALIQKRISY